MQKRPYTSYLENQVSNVICLPCLSPTMIKYPNQDEYFDPDEYLDHKGYLHPGDHLDNDDQLANFWIKNNSPPCFSNKSSN